MIRLIANDAEPGVPKSSATGTRTRVARVRAEYPNQLDYSGICIYHIPLRDSSDGLLDQQTDRQTDCAWSNSWQALSLGERFSCKMEDCESGRRVSCKMEDCERGRDHAAATPLGTATAIV